MLGRGDVDWHSRDVQMLAVGVESVESREADVGCVCNGSLRNNIISSEWRIVSFSLLL